MITKVSQININKYNNQKSKKNNLNSSSQVTFQGIPIILKGAAIAGGIATAAHFIAKNSKKIGTVLKHSPEIISKTVTKVSEDIKFNGVETIINEAGKRVPKEGFRGVAVTKLDEISGVAKLWPEIEKLDASIDQKFFDMKKHFDLDYYKDVFRLNFTIPAEKLKALREVKEPAKFSSVFTDTASRTYFQTEDGLMIYGKNESEKKKLLNHFVDEAKLHDIDVEYVSTKGVTTDVQIGETLTNVFDKAKKKFNELKKHTLLVIEDVDFILKKDGPGSRAIWNEKSLASGKDGVITLTTAKDINALDDSCVRSGRISYRINIDDAVAKQVETDKAK